MLDIYQTKEEVPERDKFSIVEELIPVSDDERDKEYYEQLKEFRSTKPLLFDFSKLSGHELFDSLLRAQAISESVERISTEAQTVAISTEKIRHERLNKVRYHF